MDEYDIILEYISSQSTVTLISAPNILTVIHKALKEAIIYKDLRFIASLEIRINHDKEKICW